MIESPLFVNLILNDDLISSDLLGIYAILIFGILLVFLVYSVVFSVYFKRKNYYLYNVYLISLIFFILTTSDVAKKIYLDKSELFYSVNFILCHVLLFISLSLFLISSLKLKKNIPKIAKFLVYFMAYPCFLVLLSIFNLQLSKMLILYLFIFFPVIFLFITFFSFRYENIFAKNYLKILIFILLAYFIYAINLNYELHTKNIFKFILYTSFVIEVIYYSFALANKLRKYSDDIKLLERKAILQDIKFHDLLDVTFDCFWETDNFGNLVYISKKIYEKLGNTNENFKFKKLEDLFSNKAPNELKIHLRAVMNKRKSFKNIDLVSEKNDGQFIWFNVNAIEKIDNYGYFQGYIGALIDETKAKYIQEEKFLENNIKSLARMAGSIAHEINNPLAYIFLGIDSVINNSEIVHLNSKDKILHTLTEMKKKGLKISQIVAKLKGLSLQSNDLIKTDCRLSAVVDMALKFCENELKTTKIKVKLSIPENEKLVTIKKEEVSKALVNLIHNAIEATENISEPTLIITIYEEGNEDIILSIMDNGIPIPIDKRVSIFEPFYTTKDFKNLGLGLTQSYQFVRRNGGNLYLDPTSSNTNFLMKFKGKDN
ncbi:ATP-binding protein [Pigmentibacter ruber]|uniref:ATP-binding protein n=1 Tax=Pigmentibacter ruber TaxID=2683196 RepID=UPI00131DC3C3|nr:ATP-binding protein [Pigmentibacter ruber]